MKSVEFKAWMESIERMSRIQRDKLRKSLEGKEDTDEVIALVERNQETINSLVPVVGQPIYIAGEKPVRVNASVSSAMGTDERLEIRKRGWWSGSHRR
ncbi:hypothetical protein [uncultured Nitrosomonas sp.]|uniref:hypothetical protein n=1 Tax=uncultured Nitrosomonas sp. TaxID=156424 RepID=UPI0025F80710|nr:hypothetical protein [uncultured Nitrosomonas sp.]